MLLLWKNIVMNLSEEPRYSVFIVHIWVWVGHHVYVHFTILFEGSELNIIENNNLQRLKIYCQWLNLISSKIGGKEKLWRKKHYWVYGYTYLMRYKHWIRVDHSIHLSIISPHKDEPGAPFWMPCYTVSKIVLAFSSHSRVHWKLNESHHLPLKWSDSEILGKKRGQIG